MHCKSCFVFYFFVFEKKRGRVLPFFACFFLPFPLFFLFIRLTFGYFLRVSDSAWSGFLLWFRRFAI